VDVSLLLRRRLDRLREFEAAADDEADAAAAQALLREVDATTSLDPALEAGAADAEASS
jgi:hypothetical protein